MIFYSPSVRCDPATSAFNILRQEESFCELHVIRYFFRSATFQLALRKESKMVMNTLLLNLHGKVSNLEVSMPHIKTDRTTIAYILTYFCDIINFLFKILTKGRISCRWLPLLAVLLPTRRRPHFN